MRIVIIVCCFLGTGLSLLYFIPTLFLNLKLEYNISSLLHKIIIQMISFRWQNKTIQYHIVFHQTWICLQNKTDAKSKMLLNFTWYTLFWMNFTRNVCNIGFAILSKWAVKYRLELTIFATVANCKCNISRTTLLQ